MINENYDKLINSFSRGNIKDIEYILSENNNYINGIEGLRNIYYLPLFEAVYLDNYELVKYLLIKGANPNKISFDEFNSISALHLSLSLREQRAANEEAEEIISLELKDDIIKLLIDYGADINLPLKNGYTPLDYAVLFKHTKGEKVLIKNNALFSKIFILNHKHILEKRYSQKEIDGLNYLETKNQMEFPLPYIHDLMRVDMNGHKDFGDILNLDLSHEITENNKNITDNYGRTPLDYAIQIGHFKAVEYLKLIGAKTSTNLNQQDKN